MTSARLPEQEFLSFIKRFEFKSQNIKNRSKNCFLCVYLVELSNFLFFINNYLPKYDLPKMLILFLFILIN